MPPPPPPGSWLQLWESLLVLGLGDERLCRPSWTVSKGAWILSWPASTDTDLLSPLAARLMLLLEQQLTAGGTRGCSSRLMCLFQDPLFCAFVPPLPLLLPCSCCLSLHTSIPKPRLSTTLLSSVPAPKLMSSVLGDDSTDTGLGELVKPTWFGERVGGNLERSGNPPSLTPPHPPLLMLLGVRMGGGLPTASSVTLSGLVAWAWGYRWLWWGNGDGLKGEDPRWDAGVEEEVFWLKSLDGAKMRRSPPWERWELVEECVTQPPEWGTPLLLTWLEQESSLLKTGEW